MTEPRPVPVDGFASVADYELRTGATVPEDQQRTVQTRLNDISALIRLYLGDCADAVEQQFGDVLTALVANHLWRAASVPTGVRSESVGATSVSYDTESATVSLGEHEIDLLDALMDTACGEDGRSFGVGQIGVSLGGEDAGTRWMRDVDAWILTGWWRK